jgi:hypothetical protein
MAQQKWVACSSWERRRLAGFRFEHPEDEAEFGCEQIKSEIA